MNLDSSTGRKNDNEHPPLALNAFYIGTLDRQKNDRGGLQSQLKT
ncbi:hypothetical protein PUP81_06250 [Pseudomonas chlororaphis]|nr:hypothetical protein [Pseudomonas chlororaphis]WDG71912.1 hypothetical protein PUP65_28070 [Pseudomonas chlororaphis]WDH30304.1 hypothetical protein PUP81_06250 [Pseudomonas chlororaphis]WDH70433.1 hypothetical protein PUP78_28025 [Pseudomonas chlororaphis]